MSDRFFRRKFVMELHSLYKSVILHDYPKHLKPHISCSKFEYGHEKYCSWIKTDKIAIFLDYIKCVNYDTFCIDDKEIAVLDEISIGFDHM